MVPSTFQSLSSVFSSHRVYIARSFSFIPSQTQIAQFRNDGFLILPQFASSSLVEQLRKRIDPLFNGEFDGNYPDEWHWRKGLSLPDITREICNAWKSDRAVASLVLSSGVGRSAAMLAGWRGARIGQDDVWSKPPHGGKEISFHTDTAYIPWEEVTCWIALQDVNAKSGTLEYVRGSHEWQKYKDRLDSTGFHAPSTSYLSTLERAAHAEGITEEELKKRIVRVEVPAGGCAFHNGNLWHGSGPNLSPHWRNSVAAHVIPSHASFSRKNVGYIYGRYKLRAHDQMDESFFPILWTDWGYRTPWLEQYCRDALPAK